ncbi:NDP-hexose 2,3-dehydratase family protein [Amycolatopsis circi]|uniref:NDP-hexose 2,3-dehydratase family protein n=1 Tax=Amycolatopsis circi TaxID=871959 RepID=UPI001FC9C193|nr:NDP-hexose 2,3-dehydratase family protein [Amycolatopsis circi]
MDALEEKLIAERFAHSAAAPGAGADDVLAWMASRAAANDFSVRRVPFTELDNWEFDAATGDLGHRSGRFFSVHGLRATVRDAAVPQWDQPIIDQPESAILGILAKEFDGVLHFLMQAKMEPGNCNLIQLSPTVQATPSNLTRVHGGSAVKYAEYFVELDRVRVLVDVLQSEHGAWFFRKGNRNMIVETREDVPLLEDFRWLTLGEIGALLNHDNAVNMDSRTVLSCASAFAADTPSRAAVRGLVSWLTEIRARGAVRARPVPLAETAGWERDEMSVHHVSGRYFSVVGTAVQAASREVGSWSQPLLEPHGLGVNAFLLCHRGGIPRVLVQAKPECGLLHGVELAPTVQAVPENYPDTRPPFFDEVLAADPTRILFDTKLSEEGGRFLDAVSTYRVVESEEFPAPPGFRWATRGELATLVEHSNYLNVQARTLLAVLNLAVPGRPRDSAKGSKPW